MWIKVVRVLDPTPSLLECDSPAGQLIGPWRGNVLPIVSEVHDVELDLLGDLECGNQVGLDQGAEGIYGSDLVGLVEDVEGQSVTLRIAGAVMLLDVVGDPRVGWLANALPSHP